MDLKSPEFFEDLQFDVKKFRRYFFSNRSSRWICEMFSVGFRARGQIIGRSRK